MAFWILGSGGRIFQGLFNSTFKTNPHLCRGIITGITRVSKESIFSDLNNLEVITTTSDKYESCFGFTEEEVFRSLDAMGLKKWYDGFTFGERTDIYNPWSILSFISKKGRYDACWSNTSGNGLVNSLIQKGNEQVKQTMGDLLQGKSFQAELDEQFVSSQLGGNPDAVWSLLLATGYLKVEKFNTVNTVVTGRIQYTLMLTNFEVKKMFCKMIKDWFHSSSQVPYNDFIKALLLNDKKAMNLYMNRVALATFSSFDVGTNLLDMQSRNASAMVLCWDRWWSWRTGMSLLLTVRADLDGMM